MSYEKQILELRSQGLTYLQISQSLNCSKSVVNYHCGKGQKQKNYERGKRNRIKQHPYYFKFYHFLNKNKISKKQAPNYSLSIRSLIRGKIKGFCRKYKSMKYVTPNFSVDDVIQKFGDNPTCYLTGELIDIHKPRTYQFDHIIPRSKGGTNTLDNLGICTKQINQSKRDMTPDEFVNMCKRVVQYNESKNK